MMHHHRAFLLVFALLGSLAGCSSGDVVAEVGKTKLRAADIDVAEAGNRRDPGATLDGLVDRALLAEAAQGARLQEDPRIAARLAQSEREILAQAFLERALENATREDALRARYARSKDALSRRVVHPAHVAVHEVASNPASRAAAEGKVSRAAARLAAGESFETVAEDTSDDVMTAGKGGDLGPIEEGQVDSAFFEAVVGLKRGEVSRPFRTSYGWHIARALEEPRAVMPDFEQVRGLLAAEARREAQADVLGKLRSEIRVVVHRERLAQGRAAVPAEGAAR